MSLPESISAAQEWLGHVRERRSCLVWDGVAPAYRLALLRAWQSEVAKRLPDEPFPDELVATLARDDCDHPDLPRVLEEMLDLVLTFFPPPSAGWGWATKPRPVAPELERALYVDASRRPSTEWAALPAVQVYMRRIDGRWLVASIGDETTALAVEEP